MGLRTYQSSLPPLGSITLSHEKAQLFFDIAAFTAEKALRLVVWFFNAKVLAFPRLWKDCSEPERFSLYRL